MVIINKVVMEEMMDISALFKLAKTGAEVANYMRQRLHPSDPKSLEWEPFTRGNPLIRCLGKIDDVIFL